MNKSKFLNKLKKKLEILNDEELNDIINEYESIIDEKVKHGKSEEEAISEFGDVSTLAKEILEAYKLNAKKVDEDDFLDSLDSTIKKGAKKLSEYTKDVVNEAEKEEITIDMIFEIIIKAIVILILLMIPFSILRSILTAFTSMAVPSNFFGNFIVSIIGGFMSLLFLALLILVIYLIIKDTTTKGSIKKSIKKRIENEVEEEIEEEIEKEIKKEMKKEKEQIKEDKIVAKKSEQNSFTTIMLTILKVILILHAIPMVFSLAFLYVVLAFSIYLLFKGVSIIGIILLIISSIIITTFILQLIFKLVKTNFRPKKVGFSSLITAFVIFLIGIFFTIDFIGSIEFVNESPIDELSYSTFTQNYVVDDNIGNLLTRQSSNYSVFIDSEMNDNVLTLEVTYSDDFLNIKEVSVSDGYIIVHSTERMKLINLFNLFVDNLKEEKIYNYTKVFDYEINLFVNQETLNSIVIEEN